MHDFPLRSNERLSSPLTASLLRWVRVRAWPLSIFSIWVVIFLVPLANRVLAQGDATKLKIEALLGLYDMAVISEQWLGLDADAGSLLEAIASDPRQLPSRRMRAFEGIVALRTANSNNLLLRRLQRNGSSVEVTKGRSSVGSRQGNDRRAIAVKAIEPGGA